MMSRTLRERDSVRVAALVCSECSRREIAAYAAGQDAVLVGSGLIIVRAIPPRGWCRDCCRERGWLAENDDISTTSEVICAVG